ncbi:MAG: HNH endonuclease signature motif containing protein [Pseudomonadota bacterium]
MTPIERARAYIRTQVQDPALLHPDLPEKIKAKVKNSNSWLSNFERVGDLIRYMKRFQLGNNDPTYQAMHALGLKTFEDIAPVFEKEFSLWVNDCTRPTDFIVGDRYSAHQILIFARSYDTRSGGMFVLESGGKPGCVVIKATLSGGHYANEWLDPPNRLKYFLKSRTDPKTQKVNFGEAYKPNEAILKNPGIPILTFVRDTEADFFVYQGVFKYVSIATEQDESKWFELIRDSLAAGVIESATFKAEVFEEETRKSQSTTKEARLARLALAPRKPQRILVLTTAYQRNPDVVAEVLDRASGNCERCFYPAPFLRLSNGSPYLEVHHKIPLAKDGEDTVKNAIALCPNCHRRSHFG